MFKLSQPNPELKLSTVFRMPSASFAMHQIAAETVGVVQPMLPSVLAWFGIGNSPSARQTPGRIVTPTRMTQSHASDNIAVSRFDGPARACCSNIDWSGAALFDPEPCVWHADKHHDHQWSPLSVY